MIQSLRHGPRTGPDAGLFADLEARHVLASHLTTLALGGNHPNAVVVPRDALLAVLAHRCGVEAKGEFAAVLPDGEIVGGFESLSDADKWAALQPDADSIVKTRVTSPGEWR